MSQRNKENQQRNHSSFNSNAQNEYKHSNSNAGTSKPKEDKRKDIGEYIEFEEIKDKN